MIIKASIYNIHSGEINRRVVCPCDHIETQCSAGQDFFLNCPPNATHIINGKPVTVAPPPPTREELISGIRVQRNHRLSASDWTQMQDVPLTTEERAAWITYRQTLRDFPSTCDPENVAWPLTPEV